MAERKGPTSTASNKLAMSRALGAAFLNHQVEQLEKTVSNVPGPASGNWRDRRQIQAEHNNAIGRGTASKRPTQTHGAKPARKNGGEVVDGERAESRPSRRSHEDSKDEKDADVIVVDASVLVHALYQIKKWCRDGRAEVVIVPLEALNTLDLLKKGTTPLAQRARAASRILEAQVGTNPRIRVQRDDAFVLWDSIAFKDLTAEYEQEKEKSTTATQTQSGGSPEWVRRTICCARWEIDNADSTDQSHKEQNVSKPDTETKKQKPKVVLAVLSSSPQVSPQFQITKLPDDRASVTASPVPLPAPHPNKHEPRSAGTLVGHWAARAGIQMLEVKPTLTNSSPQPAGNGKGADDDERVKRTHVQHVPHGGRGRRNSAQPASVPVDGGGNVGLVERPPAVMAMMEIISQPSKVVRVLARGEKLEPDP